MGKTYKFKSGKITANSFNIKPQASAPDKAFAKQGDMYVNSATGKLNIYMGSWWEAVTSSS